MLSYESPYVVEATYLFRVIEFDCPTSMKSTVLQRLNSLFLGGTHHTLAIKCPNQGFLTLLSNVYKASSCRDDEFHDAGHHHAAMMRSQCRPE